MDPGGIVRVVKKKKKMLLLYSFRFRSDGYGCYKNLMDDSRKLLIEKDDLCVHKEAKKYINITLEILNKY